MDDIYGQWQKPLTKVAEQYSVSAVALGKVDRKLSSLFKSVITSAK